MMRIVDQIDVGAPAATVFAVASDVERWPEILSHYRWVRFRERAPAGGIVEMAAWRPFPGFNWPAWWVSEMAIDPDRKQVRYRHIDGITRGMDVLWQVDQREGSTHIELVHAWDGPAWPLIRIPAARWVILPVFVHGIASRTLTGVKRQSEQLHG